MLQPARAMTRIALTVLALFLIAAPGVPNAQALGKKRPDLPRGFPIDFTCHFSGFKKGFYDCDVQVLIGHYGKREWSEQWPHYLIVQCDGRGFFSGPTSYDAMSSDGYRLSGFSDPNPEVRLGQLPKSHPPTMSPGGDGSPHKPGDSPEDRDQTEATMAIRGLTLSGYCE